MPLSDGQISLITAIPCIAAALSLMGSSIILFMIKTKRVVCNWTFTRIMVGICVFDIMGAVWTMLGPLPVPSPDYGDEDSILFLNSRLNKGTTATCTAQGFFFYLGGLGVLGYNCSLMMYYILTVVFEISEQSLLRVEPFLHACPILFSTSINVTGLFLTVYNASYYGQRCGLNAYPYNCDVIDSTTCVRGANIVVFASNFVSMPSMICLCFLLSSVLWIYCSVRRRNKEIEEHHNLDDLNRYSSHSSSQFHQRGKNESHSKNKNKRNNKTLIEVSKQSLIYAFVFFQTYFWVILRYYLRVGGANINPNAIYVIRVISEIFLPMQGFFNMLVFVRIRYRRVRRRYPRKGRLWAFQKCILERPPRSAILERYRRQGMRPSSAHLNTSSEFNMHQFVVVGSSTSQEFNSHQPQQQLQQQHQHSWWQYTSVTTSNSEPPHYNDSNGPASVNASSTSSTSCVFLEPVIEEEGNILVMIADSLERGEPNDFDESETGVIDA